MGRLFAAQSELESAIAELRTAGDLAGLSNSEASIASLAALQRDVALADGSALKSMRGEILALAANIAADSQRVREGATTAKAQHERHLAEAREESRKQVQAVMAGMRDFDPYLHFDSVTEEEAYRKREADRRAFIDRETAKGSADGDLNAVNATIAQMKDAKKHGAGESPLFNDRFEALQLAKDRLSGAIDQPEPPEQSPKAEPADDLDSALSALKAAGVAPADGSVLPTAPTRVTGRPTERAGATSGRV